MQKKFIALNAHVSKKNKINNLSFHLQKLEKEVQYKAKANRREEVVENGAEINEIEIGNQQRK